MSHLISLQLLPLCLKGIAVPTWTVGILAPSPASVLAPAPAPQAPPAATTTAETVAPESAPKATTPPSPPTETNPQAVPSVEAEGNAAEQQAPSTAEAHEEVRQDDDYADSPAVGVSQVPMATESGPSQGELELEQQPLPEPQKPLFHTLVLAEGFAKYGGVGDSLSDEDDDWQGHRTGLVGGQLTLGLMPGGKYFTMAARLGGGAFVGSEKALGTVGAAMLFGANFLRNAKGNTYSYALGGAGVEFVPGVNQDMLAFHLAGGTVVNGISFSAGLDLGTNEEFGFVVFGMQLGWGHLY